MIWKYTLCDMAAHAVQALRKTHFLYICVLVTAMSAFIIRSEIKRTNLFLSLRCSRAVGSDRHFSPFSWLVSFPQISGRVQTRPGEHVWLHGLTLCGANGGRYYFRVLYLGTAYCSTYRAQWLLMAIDGVCWLSDMRWAWLHTVLTKTFMWGLWKL